MGRVLLCVGRYAKKPYFVDKIYVNVYSVEELCYCLMQDTCLLDSELKDPKLILWLAEECGLTELSDRLGELLDKDCSAGDFAGAIMRYTGYGSEEEIKRTEESIKNGTGLSPIEKKKMRADYFLDSHKYVAALKLYDILAQELPEADTGMRARVFHDRGVAYAGLFRFEDAAESFRQAFELDGAEESGVQYLAACRMWMGETDYIRFLSERNIDYQLSLRVEQLLEDTFKEFEGTEENRMLFTLKVCREEGNPVSYYDEIERITGALKEHYREITAE